MRKTVNAVTSGLWMVQRKKAKTARLLKQLLLVSFNATN
jgi:hypothetical protein